MTPRVTCPVAEHYIGQLTVSPAPSVLSSVALPYYRSTLKLYTIPNKLTYIPTCTRWFEMLGKAVQSKLACVLSRVLSVRDFPSIYQGSGSGALVSDLTFSLSSSLQSDLSGVNSTRLLTRILSHLAAKALPPLGVPC